MLQLGFIAYSAYYWIEHIKYYERARAGIVQLVLHFALGVERVGWYNYGPGFHRSIKSNGILRDIGERDGNPISLLNAQALQSDGETICKRRELGITDFRAIIDQGCVT